MESGFQQTHNIHPTKNKKQNDVKVSCLFVKEAIKRVYLTTSF